MQQQQFEALAQNIRMALATHDRNLGQLDVIDKTVEDVHADLAHELKRLLDAANLDAWKWNDLVWQLARAEYDELELNPTFIESWLDWK